jgi:hypothetical protein
VHIYLVHDLKNILILMNTTCIDKRDMTQLFFLRL